MFYVIKTEIFMGSSTQKTYSVRALQCHELVSKNNTLSCFFLPLVTDFYNDSPIMKPPLPFLTNGLLEPAIIFMVNSKSHALFLLFFAFLL